MYRHPYWNLWLHDDEELTPFVQSRIASRETLHEWPLSCVQKISLIDNRKIIYKAQAAPSVESEFYANARSALLIGGQTIYKSDSHTCMLFEFVEATLIKYIPLTEDAIVRIGRQVQEAITRIEGETPHLIDVSTEKKWRQLVEMTLSDIHSLISAGKLSLVTVETVHNLERIALSDAVLEAISAKAGYIHGDLTTENLFILPDGGYRVIDWATPRLGPVGLDLAALVESSGFNPVKYVGVGVVNAMYFLRIHWFVRCAVRWIPEGVATYDRQIMELAARMINSDRL